MPVQRGDRMPKKTVYIIYLKDKLEKGSKCQLQMEFEGSIWQSTEGLFKAAYTSGENNDPSQYLATYMRPNNARRLFPCFDEPGFKVFL